MPQIAYYYSGYLDMIKAGSVKSGASINVCVPTGNFGNILAAWYARAIGTPIGQLYCASNENHVLTDFINSGTYDISSRPFSITPSPSMDILVSSNLERQLFELNGRNPELIRQWMQDLATKQSFQVDKTTFSTLRESFSADWVDSNDSLAVIREVFEQHHYLLDPHTAVAWRVAERLRPSADTPVLITATAHWAKFPEDVYRALNGLPVEAALPSEVAELSGSELIGLLSEQTGVYDIPKHLAELDSKSIRFNQQSDSTPEALKQSVRNWLSQQ